MSERTAGVKTVTYQKRITKYSSAPAVDLFNDADDDDDYDQRSSTTQSLKRRRTRSVKSCDDVFDYSSDEKEDVKQTNKKQKTSPKDEFDFDESAATVMKMYVREKNEQKVRSSIQKFQQQKKKTSTKQQPDDQSNNTTKTEKMRSTSTNTNNNSTSGIVKKPFKPPRKLSSSLSSSLSSPVAKSQLSLEEYYKMDGDLFTDSFEDVFNNSYDTDDNEDDRKVSVKSIETKSKGKKNNKKKKEQRVKQRVEVKKSGEDQLLLDEIYDLIDGLNTVEDEEIQCESASTLADKCMKMVDFGIFLRAHNMIQTVLQTLAQCYQRTEKSNNKQLSMLIVNIISMLLTDPLNVDYITDESFTAIHNAIKSHPVFQALKNHLSNSSSSQRTRRHRAAALTVTNYKDGVKKKNSDETNTSTTTITTSTDQKLTISRALAAMATIVSRQQTLFEIDLSNRGDISDTMILERAKEKLLFHKLGAIVTIERLVPSLLVELEQRRDESLVMAMCKCIRMLEQSGLYKKYTTSKQRNDNDDNEQEDHNEAWNMLLPALIRLLQCLSNWGTYLSDLTDKSSIVECTTIVLTFLTNITNKNEDACSRIGVENGLTAILQVIASNNSKHFDIITLSCGVLANMTENNWNNRELLRGLKLPEPLYNKSFTDYITQLYSQQFLTLTTSLDAQQQQQQEEVSSRNEKEQRESLVISSYLAILIGCLVKDHERNRRNIVKHLPNHSFDCIISTLKQFILFQSNANLLIRDTLDSINQMIHDLTTLQVVDNK